MSALSESDRAEIALFKLYLDACKRWNLHHDTRPDWAGRSMSDLENIQFFKAQIKAHAEIYAQIYGEKP